MRVSSWFLAKKYMTTMLVTGRIFEAAFLTLIADFTTARDTKELMVNQNATFSRNDSNENQYILGG